jgi:hypothetical protein
MKWRRRESNPLLLGASEVLCRQSLVPKWLLSPALAAADAGFAGVGSQKHDRQVQPAHIPEQEREAVRWGAPRCGADN